MSGAADPAFAVGAGVSEAAKAGVGASNAWVATVPFSLLRFLSSVLMNAFTVVRKLLFGMQSAAESGEWLQIGQVSGRSCEPVRHIRIDEGDLKATKQTYKARRSIDHSKEASRR